MPVTIDAPFPTNEEVAKIYGISKSRMNRLLKLYEETREPSRNGHGKPRIATTRKAQVNGTASTRAAKRSPRARKRKLGSASR
jgi:transposase